MEKFQVSVIIPVFNAAAFVQRAVESAVMQAETAEVVLIDDGSTDGSFVVCCELSKKYDNVKLYFHPRNINLGASASRNLGIKKARFPFISFLDADDFYLSGRFVFDKKLFHSDATIDGVYGCVKAEFENETAKEKFLAAYNSELTTLKERIDPKDLLYILLFGESGRFHTNAITLKKKVFDHLQPFDPELRMGEDTELWARIAAIFHLAAGQTEQPIAIRWVHGNNSIHCSETEKDKYRTILFSKLFYWSVGQSNLSFGKKNYFFVLYWNSVNENKLSPFRFLYSLIRKSPLLLLRSFTYRKIYQITITK